MKSLRHLRLLLIPFLLQACGGSDEVQAPRISHGEGIAGLALPVQLDYGESRIYLGDFVEFPERVGGIHFSDALDFTHKADSGLVVVSNWRGEHPVAAMGFEYEGKRYEIPVFRNSAQLYRFTYAGGQGAAEVSIKGNFNGWNHKANPLSRGDDAWYTELVLPPGLYEYMIVEDGREMLDETNPMKKDNGQGGFNSTFVVGSVEAPPYITTYGMSGDSVVLFYPEELHAPHIFWENHLLSEGHYKRRGDRLALALPRAAASLERSHLRVFGCDEEQRSNDVLVPLHKGKPILDPQQLRRDDKHTYAMYFMMVDRFVNGDLSNDEPVQDPEILPPANYYGGDLAGVLQKIEEGYFSDLGTNTIWLSPITQNPLGAYGLWDKGGVRSKFSGYHGYWPISSSRVDHRFGDASVLKDLITAAHASDANVILDYVANHVHEEHPVYRAHPEWATSLHLPDGRLNTELWDEQRLTTWFDTFMPTLDLENPEVVAAMTDSALFWFENYPIDGFRHDATKHIPLGFWRELTRKLKYRVVVPEGRAIYQIGETYGNPQLIGSYIGSGLLDAQFDFNLYDAAVAAFAKKESSMRELDRVVQESLGAYGFHHLMGNISGNQDRARFISYADGSVDFAEDAKLAGWTRKIEIQDEVGYERLALLHALNFTLPGVPVIYNGDEIGMPGANDPDNRRMMRFGDELNEREQELLATVSDLARLRKESMPLLYGDLQVLHVDDMSYAYARSYLGEVALLAINKSDQTAQLSIELPKHFNSEQLRGHFKPSDHEVSDGQLKIELQANSFEILTP